jgi:hypothetical protein
MINLVDIQKNLGDLIVLCEDRIQENMDYLKELAQDNPSASETTLFSLTPVLGVTPREAVINDSKFYLIMQQRSKEFLALTQSPDLDSATLVKSLNELYLVCHDKYSAQKNDIQTLEGRSPYDQAQLKAARLHGKQKIKAKSNLPADKLTSITLVEHFFLKEALSFLDLPCVVVAKHFIDLAETGRWSGYIKQSQRFISDKAAAILSLPHPIEEKKMIGQLVANYFSWFNNLSQITDELNAQNIQQGSSDWKKKIYPYFEMLQAQKAPLMDEFARLSRTQPLVVEEPVVASLPSEENITLRVEDSTPEPIPAAVPIPQVERETERASPPTPFPKAPETSKVAKFFNAVEEVATPIIGSKHLRLIENIFATPTPHYEIKYDELKNLLIQLGGEIKNLGGSARKISLPNTLGYFTEDVSAEVVGLHEKHGTSHSSGKVSRKVIERFKAVLTRAGLTPQTLQAPQKSAVLSSSSQASR